MARRALVCHFPYSPETREFLKSDGMRPVALDYRRCAYRDHTRRMGLPTSIRYVIVEPSLGAAEWGTTAGGCESHWVRSWRGRKC
jgi:hypothetical protein